MLKIPIQEGAYFSQQGEYTVMVEQYMRVNPVRAFAVSVLLKIPGRLKPDDLDIEVECSCQPEIRRIEVIIFVTIQHRGDLTPQAKFCKPPFPFQGNEKGSSGKKSTKFCVRRISDPMLNSNFCLCLFRSKYNTRLVNEMLLEAFISRIF